MNPWIEYVAQRLADGNSTTVTPATAGYDSEEFYQAVRWRVAEIRKEPILSEWYRWGDELR